MAQGGARSATEAGLSPNGRPRVRRRTSDAMQQDNADPLAEADAAPEARPYEVCPVQGVDVLKVVNSAFDSTGALSCDTADKVVVLQNSIRQQLDVDHYHGGVAGLIAAVFSIPVTVQHPTMEHLQTALGSAPAAKQAVDNGKTVAALRTLFGTIRSQIFSMGPALQSSQTELPQLLDTWENTVSQLHALVAAAMSVRHNNLGLLDTAIVQAKPYEDQTEDVKLQCVLTSRIRMQKALLINNGATRQLAREMIVELSGGERMHTHVWQPLFTSTEEELKRIGSTSATSGEPLTVKLWCRYNHIEGVKIEDTLFSKESTVNNCEKYISGLPSLQLSPPQLGLFCFGTEGGRGALVDIFAEKVSGMLTCLHAPCHDLGACSRVAFLCRW